MLSHNNYLEEIFDLENLYQQGHVQLNIVASELMERLGYCDNSDFNAALMRSLEVCTALKIPIKQNFKKFYSVHNSELVTDWYLSDLASYLIAINGNTCNPNVAKAQLQFMLTSKNKR